MHMTMDSRRRRRPSWEWSLLGILCALMWHLSTPAWGLEPMAGEFYVVRPGDTCQDIVRRSGGNLTLEAFHTMNPSLVGPGPHLLVPETSVRVRAGTTAGAEAQLTFVKPEVKVVKGRSAPKSASVGQALQALDQVWTEQAAACEVTFKDSSSLWLSENSALVLYGPRPERSPVRTRQVKLEAGVVKGGLASLRGEATTPLRVETPSASIQVTSPELSVEVDVQLASLVSVYQGRAIVSGRGKSVTVRADEGTVTHLGKPPEAPRPLPAAPEWVGWPGGLKRITEQAAPTSIAWTPVSGASEYVLELARDARFRQDLIVKRVEGTRRALSVPPGRWYLRVAARDSAGLQGGWSVAPELVVVRLALEDGRGMPVKPDESPTGGGPRDDVLVGRGAVRVVRVEAGVGLRLRIAPLSGATGEGAVVQEGLELSRPGIYVVSVEDVEGTVGTGARTMRLLVSVLPSDTGR